jgi:hypothetical protein
MTRCRLLLFILFVVLYPAYGQTSQQRPKHETWYERVLRRLNPEDIDYGAIFEQRKQALLSRLRDGHFQLSAVSTAAAVCLLTIVWVQRISHRRALNIAVDSMADVLRHDQYSREVAREAIRRYNDHIESCNRVIEAEQTGLWQWTSSRELAELNEKVETAQAEIKRLEAELETKVAMIAELSLRGNQPLPTTPSSAVPAQYIDRINELELEIKNERKKNLRTSLLTSVLPLSTTQFLSFVHTQPRQLWLVINTARFFIRTCLEGYC